MRPGVCRAPPCTCSERRIYACMRLAGCGAGVSARAIHVRAAAALTCACVQPRVAPPGSRLRLIRAGTHRESAAWGVRPRAATWQRLRRHALRVLTRPSAPRPAVTLAQPTPDSTGRRQRHANSCARAGGALAARQLRKVFVAAGSVSDGTAHCSSPRTARDSSHTTTLSI
jgi:hypothetical protein